MKVVILAGGLGTRLSEYTNKIPKPMVDINGTPMIEHIMNHYSTYGFNEFILCLGYKQDIIKDYFVNFNLRNSDIHIDLNLGNVTVLKKPKRNWKISLINTGLNTMTGGRIKKIKDLITEKTFLLTYGDGLSNINIQKLIEYHHRKNKSITLSAVRPQARFGELEINNGLLENFQTKEGIKIPKVLVPYTGFDLIN